MFLIGKLLVFSQGICQKLRTGKEAGQIHSQNVGVLPSGQQYIPGSNVLNQLTVQICNKITGTQHLMVGTAFNDPVQNLIAGLHILKSAAPKGNVDRHGILRIQALLPEGRIFQTFGNQLHTLVADSVDIPGFITHNTDPGTHRPLDSGISDQIILQNGGQDGMECLYGAAVRPFTDHHPQALLELGGKKQSAQQLVHPGIVAHDNTFHKAPGNTHKPIVSVDDLRYHRFQLRVILIQGIGQHFRHIGRVPGGFVLAIAHCLLRQIAGENVLHIRINGTDIRHTVQNMADSPHIVHIGIGTEAAAEVALGIGKIPHPVHHTQKGFLIPVINRQTENPGHLLQEEF